MTGGGYIKVWRKLFADPDFRDDFERGAFLRLVALAAWRPTKVKYKGRIVELERGQLVISIRDLEAQTGLSKKRVETLLRRLEVGDSIGRKTETPTGTSGATGGGTGVTVITICNYDVYQGDDDERGQQRGQGPGQARRQKGDSNGDTEQEVKNLEYISPPISPPLTGDPDLLGDMARQERAAESSDPEFETWWAGYPKKVSRGAAARAFRTARKKASLRELTEGLERYKATKPAYADWCHAATWLNGERWLDKPDDEPAAGAGDSGVVEGNWGY